jgi:hypothetical protein
VRLVRQYFALQEPNVRCWDVSRASEIRAREI